MAINAYTGVMGSGKSYEVVASVILPAIEQGRRVVTNVDGINEEKIYAYLVEFKKVDPIKLGRVVHVKNEDIVSPGFFPDEENPERSSVVQGGDLVAIDEAWRFWGQGEKITIEHMQFFRMHRHYVHPDTKVTCDMALMVQAIVDLNRNIRAVVELTCVMTKLKTIGMNKSYRVEMYEGGRTVKSAKFETYVKRYDKCIFPLYQSYTGGAGNEKAIDKRQNVFKNPRLWAYCAGMVLLFFLCVWGLYAYYRHQVEKFSPKDEKGKSVPSAALGAPGVPAVVGFGKSVQSDTLRIAGEVVLHGQRWVLLVDQDGTVRLENPAVFVGRGLVMVGNVEGRRVATWTGVTPKRNSIVGGVK